MTHSDIAEFDNVTPAFCSPELSRQLCAFLGEDYAIYSLVRHIKKRAPFKESRGILRSFNDEPDIYSAQQEIFETAKFESKCEPDGRGKTEIADYVPLGTKKEGEPETVRIRISPNALKAIYMPVSYIYETKSPHFEGVLSPKERDSAVNISYTSIYAGVIAKYAVEKHVVARANEDHSDAEIDETRAKINDLYEEHFKKDGSSVETRLGRLSMALGGAAMFRYVATKMSQEFDTNLVDIGSSLKLFSLGMRNANPRDTSPVSFSMAHLFTPHQATEFIDQWFGQAA